MYNWTADEIARIERNDLREKLWCLENINTETPPPIGLQYVSTPKGTRYAYDLRVVFEKDMSKNDFFEYQYIRNDPDDVFLDELWVKFQKKKIPHNKFQEMFSMGSTNNLNKMFKYSYSHTIQQLIPDESILAKRLKK